MSAAYSGIVARKSVVLMHRTCKYLDAESTIEDRTLRLLDVSIQVKQIERAESIGYYLPDGSTHQYTPDFTVTLHSGLILSLECKPVHLLSQLLEAETLAWHARATVLESVGRPLYLITDANLPETWLEYATRVGSFVTVTPHADITSHAIYSLEERGAMVWSELRAFLLSVGGYDKSSVDATIYALLARHELVADVSVPFSTCRIDLPDRSIVFPPPPVGRPFQEVLVEVLGSPALPSPPALVRSPHELRFLKTEWGQRLLRLFSSYPDPTVPLSANRLKELTQLVGLSRSAIYRFKQVLQADYVPGMTFADLIPALSQAYGKPRCLVDVRVTSLMERLAREHYYVRMGTVGRARNVSELHQIIRKACLQEELSPPAYNTVDAFVKRVEARDPIKAITLRQGREMAQLREPRQGHLNVACYGELIAIDCTPCDVFTHHKDGFRVEPRRAGRGKGQCKPDAVRGNMIVVLDVATKQILRSSVFMGAIGAVQVLQVLRELFMGNVDALAVAGVTDVPQAQGLPLRMRMDGGTEFVNKEVSRVLAHLGIEVVRRNKWSKHFGGAEERAISLLSFPQQGLPGTSTNTVQNRGEYDAQRGAVLDITDMERYLQRLLQGLNAQCAPLMASTRQQHAQNLIDSGQSVWRPLSLAQRDYVQNRFYPQEVRKCQRYGISLHGLSYVSPEIASLIIKRADVEITYNPDDISVAHVIDPTTGVGILVHARFPSSVSGPLSLKEWKKIKSRIIAHQQAAQASVPTVAQLAQQIVAEREQQNAAQRQTVKRGSRPRSLKPLAPDEVTGRIRAADITFDSNPPSSLGDLI